MGFSPGGLQASSWQAIVQRQAEAAGCRYVHESLVSQLDELLHKALQDLPGGPAGFWL